MTRSLLRHVPIAALGVASVLLFARVSFAQEGSPDPADPALDPLPPASEQAGAPAAAPPPAYEPPPPPKFVVLATKAKGGPNLKRPVKKLVEKPLKKNKKYTLLPFKKYKRAGRKMRIKRKDLFSAASAQAIGETLGLTHILIVEGAMEQRPIGKKKVKVFFAVVNLIDVKSGDVTHTKRWALKGKKLSKDIAVKLVERIEEALEPPPPPPPPEPEPEPPPPPPPEPPPEPPPPVEPDEDLALPEAAASDEASSAISEADAAEEPLPGDSIPAGEPPIEDTTVASLDQPLAVEKEAPPPQKLRSDRWRPFLHTVVGGMGMTRRAAINAKAAPQTPPCFCSRDPGVLEPVFPAGYFAVEFFPLAMPALGGDGAIYEGIGLHGEAFMTHVTTIIDSAGNQVESNVPYFRGGPSFRFVWWDSTVAPDVRLDLGMSYFHFPLKNGAFPGVKYWGQFYVGLNFNVPLFTEYVGLVAGGLYTILTEPGGKTKRLGQSVRWTSNYLVQGGLRASLWLFEARLLFRYQHFSGRWNGTTDLDLGVQFNNPKLTDEIVGGIVSVGVAL